MNTHNYLPRKGIITAKKAANADTVYLEIKIPGKPFAFRPGQFVMLSTLGYGEVPIGIASAPGNTNRIEVAIRNMGAVTAQLVSLEVGGEIGVAGPFGNGFATSKLKGKDVVIVAGGLGLPPLRALVKLVEENPKLVKSLTVFTGAKTPEGLLYQEEYDAWSKFAKVYPIVDQGSKDWTGAVGMIPDLFEKVEVSRGAVMLVCGPPVMYPSVITHYAGKRVAESDLYFLLERRMECGVGKCQHCTCGEKYVCLDGPVFAYDEIKYNREAFK